MVNIDTGSLMRQSSILNRLARNKIGIDGYRPRFPSLYYYHLRCVFHHKIIIEATIHDSSPGVY